MPSCCRHPLAMLLALGLTACGEAGPRIQITALSDMVDVPQEVLQASGAGQRRAYAGGSTTVLYLNFNGAQVVKSYNSDAATNTSFIGGGTVPPFNGDQATRDQVVALVKQLYAKYNIQIVTSRPTSGDYDMALIGGSPADLGLAYPSNVTGVAPMDCDDQMPRDIAFVFAASIQSMVPASKLAQRVAETAAHESAHTYGLPHSGVGCDLMSYSSCAQLKTFLDQDMPMQSDSYGKCGMYSMNSHQLLMSSLGPKSSTTPPPPGDTEPPKVSITSPANGATVAASVTVRASISDNTGVTQATLLVDGQTVTSDSTAPYELPASLSTGPHTLKVVAQDAAGNTGAATVTVTVQAPSSPPPSDTQPPRVTITSPGDGATVAAQVGVQGTASDASGVNRVDLLVDGKLVSSLSASPFSFSATLAAGTHALRVEAEDPAGNRGGATVTVTVDPGQSPAPTDPTAPDPSTPGPAPAPGSYGSTCQTAADCQSGICAEDPADGVRYCTQPCDPQSDTCPGQTGCYPTNTPAVSVCGPPATGPAAQSGDQLMGGCSVGGKTGAPTWPLVLLVLGLLARRRRR